jgi:hypothetical protein
VGTRGALGATLIALTLGLSALPSCNGPRVNLQVQGDVDDDDDETPIPCNDAGMCFGLEERLCHPSGYCVECVTDDDCRTGWVCDSIERECEPTR